MSVTRDDTTYDISAAGNTIHIRAVDKNTFDVYTGKKDVSGLIYSAEKYARALIDAFADGGTLIPFKHDGTIALRLTIVAPGESITSMFWLERDTGATIAELRRELARVAAPPPPPRDVYRLVVDGDKLTLGGRVYDADTSVLRGANPLNLVVSGHAPEWFNEFTKNYAGAWTRLEGIRAAYPDEFVSHLIKLSTVADVVIDAEYSSVMRGIKNSAGKVISYNGPAHIVAWLGCQFV